MTPVLRHACSRCGASCTGHRVLLQPGEAERLEALADELGVSDPVEGTTLRLADGRCVFLTESRLCGIHEHAGLGAKPLACQQYPLVVVRTEEDLRLGLDPGCLNTWQSWRTGPAVDPERVLASRVEMGAEARAIEIRVLGLCEQATSVGGLLGALVDEPPVDGLPPAWAAAWATACRAVGLPAPEIPPKWVLGTEGEALGVETVRRMVHLRLATDRGAADQVARLVLGGALLAAWRDPDLPAFGTGLAQWTRSLRESSFYERLVRADPS